MRWQRVLILIAVLLSASVDAQIRYASDVFVGNEEGPLGTSNYRIPGLTTAADGSLLAFAEGRRSGSDPGQAGRPIDLVTKRSTDGGRSWSPLTVLQANPAFDYDDPTPVLDRTTGDVHLLFSRVPDGCGLFCVPAGTDADSMNVFQMTSVDNGQSWSEARNITAEVKHPSWRGIVAGPGNGIQLQWQTDANRNGRLVIPASINANENFVFYSDDAGSNWQSGELAQSSLGLGGFTGNENEVVELTNGDVLMNARQGSGRARRVFRSQDGGQSWLESFSGDFDITTVDSSMIRYSAIRAGDDRNRLLFSGPSGNPPGSGSGRSNIAVWTSYDEGKSFTNPVVMEEGFGAYSVLTKLADDSIGLLYEATGSTQIRYLSFGTPALEGGRHAASTTHFDGWANSIEPLNGGVGWSGRWEGQNAAIASGGLEFPQFETLYDDVHLAINDGMIERRLSRVIDLNQNATSYVSLFVRSNMDGSDSSTQEWLDIRLQSNGVSQFAFGVDSDEAFFVRNSDLGTTVTTSGDQLQSGIEYLLLVRIESTSGLSGSDQISLAYFDDASALPAHEDEVVWSLLGETSDNFASSLDSILIAGGSQADWSIDALRIADSFSGALVDNGLSGVAGDINQDGFLDLHDRNLFVENWRTDGYETLSEMMTHGDFTRDGLVSLPDAFVLHQAFRDAGFDMNLGDLLAPEPQSNLLAMFSLGGLFVTVRHKQKQNSHPAKLDSTNGMPIERSAICDCQTA